MRRPNLSGFSTATFMPPPSLDASNTDTINRGRLEGALLVLVQNTKGGPGKTTCLLNLAVGYKLQGKRVLIVDADTRQKTAKKWPRPANVRYPVIVECDPCALLEWLARWIHDFDVILIDTPGRDEPALGAILPVIDLLVAPSKPSLQDLPELENGIRIADAYDVPHLVLFNEATREWTAELEGLSNTFRRFGPFSPIAMKGLVGYRHAYANGAGVLEYRYADEARLNFERVFKAVATAVEEAHAAWFKKVSGT